VKADISDDSFTPHAEVKAGTTKKPPVEPKLVIPCKVVSSADQMATTFVDAPRTMSSSLHPVSIVMDVRLTTRE
jgi:hypothetical protein